MLSHWGFIFHRSRVWEGLLKLARHSNSNRYEDLLQTAFSRLPGSEASISILEGRVYWLHENRIKICRSTIGH
jgi:hypothetical protein